MGLYVVASAKGSPGVTTTAVVLAGAWPVEPVLADLDPAGGDVALRYRDEAGAPLDPERGLLSLGAAVRRGSGETLLADHVQRVSGGLEVLTGVSSPSQVQGLGPAWLHLARLLGAAPERDVIADCGRLMPGSATVPVLQNADAVLLVARPTVEGLAHLRERLHSFSEVLQFGTYEAVPVGVALVTSYRDGRVVGDVQSILDRSRLPVTVLGILAEDEKAADAIRTGDGGRARKSLLVRSGAEVAERLHRLGRPRPQSQSQSVEWGVA
jgi:MinD-like ATPase involved in chromosome partitioning or flagellar assembly